MEINYHQQYFREVKHDLYFQLAYLGILECIQGEIWLGECFALCDCNCLSSFMEKQ